MASSASTSSDRPSTCGFVGGPPGIRTPNLRIKSLVRSSRSESRGAREQPNCVSVLPIVSHRFPFLHGDEAGMSDSSALSFRLHRAAVGAGWPIRR